MCATEHKWTRFAHNELAKKKELKRAKRIGNVDGTDVQLYKSRKRNAEIRMRIAIIHNTSNRFQAGVLSVIYIIIFSLRFLNLPGSCCVCRFLWLIETFRRIS